MVYYRVEHWVGDVRVVLGRIAGAAHHTTLAPFASHLRLAGHTTGALVLVDEASGTIVARRRLVVRCHKAAIT